MWGKLAAIVGVGAFVLASAGLLCEPPGQEQGTQTAPPVELSWVDEKTGGVLFTVADIVRFDWERQLFELKRSCVMDLMAFLLPRMGVTRGFVVRDAEGIIYKGYFVSPTASAFPTEPHFTFMPRGGSPVVYRIQQVVPVGVEDDKTRFDPRLLAALERANVLAEITDEDEVSWIRSSSGRWVEVQPGIKAWVDYFDETLRVGEEARAHIFLTASDDAPSADDWDIHITLTANDGAFQSELSTLGVELDIVRSQGYPWRAAYVCRFRPWQPAAGSADTTPKPGPAKIALTVIAKKDGETVDTWETASCEVSILPAN